MYLRLPYNDQKLQWHHEDYNSQERSPWIPRIPELQGMSSECKSYVTTLRAISESRKSSPHAVCTILIHHLGRRRLWNIVRARSSSCQNWENTSFEPKESNAEWSKWETHYEEIVIISTSKPDKKRSDGIGFIFHACLIKDVETLINPWKKQRYYKNNNLHCFGCVWSRCSGLGTDEHKSLVEELDSGRCDILPTAAFPGWSK